MQKRDYCKSYFTNIKNKVKSGVKCIFFKKALAWSNSILSFLFSVDYFLIYLPKNMLKEANLCNGVHKSARSVVEQGGKLCKSILAITFIVIVLFWRKQSTFLFSNLPLPTKMSLFLFANFSFKPCNFSAKKISTVVRTNLIFRFFGAYLFSVFNNPINGLYIITPSMRQCIQKQFQNKVF